MAASDDASTTLLLTARAAGGSRSARRLRRTGSVPGVIYGGDREPESFAVDARILRNTLARSGAIVEISVDGGTPGPVLVKDVQRHPVRGEAVHVDFLRVRMDRAIHTPVGVELIGADVAPGVVEGGVLSQGVVELNVEALPGDLPDVIHVDVSTLEINHTVTLTPPSQEPADDEIETETELVGAEAAEGRAEGDTAEEAARSASDSGAS
jgi:large subunit ribosomal protein L25